MVENKQAKIQVIKFVEINAVCHEWNTVEIKCRLTSSLKRRRHTYQSRQGLRHVFGSGGRGTTGALLGFAWCGPEARPETNLQKKTFLLRFRPLYLEDIEQAQKWRKNGQERLQVRLLPPFDYTGGGRYRKNSGGRYE